MRALTQNLSLSNQFPNRYRPKAPTRAPELSNTLHLIGQHHHGTEEGLLVVVGLDEQGQQQQQGKEQVEQR